ncbi:uncharacterized protein BO66DRAFT_117292 [Aspergillus aculeatinus CBS 121060]|uniref:Uncharacterized protein n=1 Tax=Aspergillus aculeatinus CBS 121060 TaxID=1448322 RepID=A0ACD1H5X3_9EURO|nr:hypothetical protein BO66DRAFT_117292 [Aspergillus aculeatinus CBS 121060]RAH68908.1 hypothetical protein BO66DRAFT_117292 [Aspergillus aculeatinus CBS 121060]
MVCQSQPPPPPQPSGIPQALFLFLPPALFDFLLLYFFFAISGFYRYRTVDWALFYFFRRFGGPSLANEVSGDYSIPIPSTFHPAFSRCRHLHHTSALHPSLLPPSIHPSTSPSRKLTISHHHHHHYPFPPPHPIPSHPIFLPYYSFYHLFPPFSSYIPLLFVTSEFRPPPSPLPTSPF